MGIMCGVNPTTEISKTFFKLQDDISRTIANKLRKNLSASDHEKTLVSVPTDNMEAYKKYMQGIHYRNVQSLEVAVKAMQCFNEAVTLEPNFVNPNFNIVELNAFFRPNAGW